VSYAIVTAVLAGVFALVVLAPTAVIGRGTRVPNWVVAAATLVVALLFQPVRSRVQAGVDRRFNRARFDAVTTVEAFTARLREEIDLEALERELGEVVGATMQPAHLGLWIAPRRS